MRMTQCSQSFPIINFIRIIQINNWRLRIWISRKVVRLLMSVPLRHPIIKWRNSRSRRIRLFRLSQFLKDSMLKQMANSKQASHLHFRILLLFYLTNSSTKQQTSTRTRLWTKAPNPKCKTSFASKYTTNHSKPKQDAMIKSCHNTPSHQINISNHKKLPTLMMEKPITEMKLLIKQQTQPLCLPLEEAETPSQ